MSALTEATGVAALSGDTPGDISLGLVDQLWDLLPIAVYVCDRDGRLVRFNRHAALLWGREPSLHDPVERFCGSHRMYRLDGGPMSHGQCPMADVLRTGHSVRDQEVVIERPDGSRIVASVNIAPLKDRAGTIVGAVNCFEDISERKRAEAALHERDRQSRMLLDALPAAIYMTDAAGKITYFNKAAVELVGREPALGSDEWCVSWKLLWPDGSPMQHHECPMATALKEDRPIRGVQAIAERPDGTRVPFIPYPTPLHDAGGALIGAVNMLVDISDRKRADEIAQRLAAIVESSDDAIVSKDLNGTITSWNNGAERLFGYLAEEVIGKRITILIPPDHQQEEDAILDRIRRGQRVEHYETVRRRKNGSLVDVSLSVSPVRDANGKVAGASKIARDITDRKRSEIQIAILAREAEHRSKNVLSTVQATVRLTTSETVDGLKEAINGRIQALANVHTLLAQSHWTGAELRGLAAQQLSLYCKDGEERARIDGPQLMLDPSAAQAVAVTLHELATNAAKYGALAAPGGRVQVEWSRSDPERLLTLRWIETGGPQVRSPTHRGFGVRMVEAMVRGQLDGEVSFDWRAEGLVCEISIPG